MPELHSKQKRILELLKSSDDSLSMRELQDAIGASSPSVVHHHIVQLEKKGYLRRNPNDPQDYQILADTPDKEVTYLNVYGLAQCGPNGLLADSTPIERIPISSKLLGFASVDGFMVKARGDSMKPFIKENDYVIVKRNTTPENGDIVVAVNDGKAVIKKFNRQGNNILLESINPDFRPFLAEDNFQVEGVVRGVYKYTG